MQAAIIGAQAQRPKLQKVEGFDSFKEDIGTLGNVSKWGHVYQISYF